MNALIDSVRRCRPLAGKNIHLRATPNGVIIDGTPDSEVVSKRNNTSRMPFAVRWYVKSDDKDKSSTDDGEWQVYLPRGCATVNGEICTPTNANAVDADGNKIDDWYVIAPPKDSDADIATMNNRKCIHYSVYAHIKAWPEMKISFSEKDGDFGRSHRTEVIAAAGYYEKKDDDENVRKYRTVRQLVTSSISVRYQMDSAFAIEYRKSGDKEKSYKPYVVNQSVMIGREQFTGAEETSVDGATKVVLHIAHKTEKFDVEVVTPNGDVPAADNDNTYVKIYDMEDNVVTFDNRAALDNLNFYNN